MSEGHQIELTRGEIYSLKPGDIILITLDERASVGTIKAVQKSIEAMLNSVGLKDRVAVLIGDADTSIQIVRLPENEEKNVEHSAVPQIPGHTFR